MTVCCEGGRSESRDSRTDDGIKRDEVMVAFLYQIATSMDQKMLVLEQATATDMAQTRVFVAGLGVRHLFYTIHVCQG